ncbi:hypothetical protein DH2020_027713 [Rehmannia glutinosa]|uniref:Uncharacterized protein n=1 Tax=Rehmannia glutinosa TaxID=99300 RepID=A0ABR0VTE4_REHGL
MRACTEVGYSKREVELDFDWSTFNSGTCSDGNIYVVLGLTHDDEAHINGSVEREINERSSQTRSADVIFGSRSTHDRNILIGTIDTSSSTIIWALTALVKKPSAMKKVQQEIRSSLIGKKRSVVEDDIEKFPYLKAIIKETMRLYPPNPLSVPRETTDRCIVDGYEIQPKTIVFMNTWAVGRDPNYWENPNEFMPERFLNRNIDFKGQDFGLLPFGSGRRSCPGLSLGVAVVEMALANLLYSFDWELPHGMSEEDIDTQGTQGLTMQKKNPLCLMAKTYF